MDRRHGVNEVRHARGAAVLGAMRAVAELQCRSNVVVIVATPERIAETAAP